MIAADRAWGHDPLVVVSLAAVGAVYLRGRLRRPARARWRRWSADAGLVVVALALVSPVDAAAAELASAHMVQHVLLIHVAAPLLVLGAPVPTILHGLPSTLRRRVAPLGASRTAAATRGALRHPVVAWLLHAGALWVWHSAVLYDAAVRHPLVHALEHAAFLGTALLFWGVVLGAGRSRRIPEGAALLLVFTMALQSILLSALLTFAPTPWYSVYAESAAAWSLDPLADQQLAGVIMWVPAGLVYVGAALTLLAMWIRSSEPAAAAAADLLAARDQPHPLTGRGGRPPLAKR